MLIGRRLQEHRVDHTEDRRVSADANRDGEDRDGRGQRRFSDQPECVPEIVQHGTTLRCDYGTPMTFESQRPLTLLRVLAPLLPKGTILKVTAWHDNTTAKKSNPDPNQWVGWGDRTVDEMAHAWINIVYMKDEDFKIEQEKRRSTATPTTLQQQ